MGRGIIGAPPTDGTLLYDVTGSAATITIPFAANAYTRIEYYLSVESNAFGGTVMTLTGLTANSYNVGGTNGYAAGAAGWLLMGDTGPFDFQGTIWLPAAPRRKSHFSGFSTNAGAGIQRGKSTDVTNDPTAIVVAFGAVYTYRAIFRGY